MDVSCHVHKRVLLIATKADLFAENFQDELGLAPFQYYVNFVEHVNNQLMQSEQIQALVRETAGTEIYPVYFQTTEDDEGKRIPMRDDSGSVMVVGFDRLLTRLGE